MTSRRFSSRRLCWVVLAFALPQAAAQSAARVEGTDLDALVRGRTLAISFYGDPTNPAVTFVWDFRKDGVLCGRLAGAKRGTACAEQGAWKLSEGVVCWELPSIGKSHGFNPACSAVMRETGQRFELRNQKSPDLSFGKFLALAP